MASLAVAYVLWFFFGWLGIHHLYLGRVNQAFVWFATCGGGFGVGWLRDLWRLPDYVRWCNANQDLQARRQYIASPQYRRRVQDYVRSHCSNFQLFSMLAMGYLVASVFTSLLPDRGSIFHRNRQIHLVMHAVLAAIGNVVGVHLVINTGELMSPIPYLCAGPVIILCYVVQNVLRNSNNSSLAGVTLANTIATVSVTWLTGTRWRPLKTITNSSRNSRREQLLVYFVLCFGWLSIVYVAETCHGGVRFYDGDRIFVMKKFLDFLKNCYYKFFEFLQQIWLYAKHYLHEFFQWLQQKCLFAKNSFYDFPQGLGLWEKWLYAKDLFNEFVQSFWHAGCEWFYSQYKEFEDEYFNRWEEGRKFNEHDTYKQNRNGFKQQNRRKHNQRRDKEACDFTLQGRPHEVLKLPPGVSDQEKKKRCRHVRGICHPDMFYTEEDKEKAARIFTEIGRLCD